MKIVERRIPKELKGCKGANGWSCNSTHFVCILVRFCIEVLLNSNGKSMTETKSRMVMLALSPM